MFNMKNILFLVILSPDSAPTAPKVFKRLILISLRMCARFNLPFTWKYSQLQVDS